MTLPNVNTTNYFLDMQFLSITTLQLQILKFGIKKHKSKVKTTIDCYTVVLFCVFWIGNLFFSKTFLFKLFVIYPYISTPLLWIKFFLAFLPYYIFTYAFGRKHKIGLKIAFELATIILTGLDFQNILLLKYLIKW